MKILPNYKVCQLEPEELVGLKDFVIIFGQCVHFTADELGRPASDFNRRVYHIIKIEDEESEWLRWWKNLLLIGRRKFWTTENGC